MSLGSFPNEIGRGIVWAVGVHAVGALVVGGLPGTDLDTRALLSGWPGDASDGLAADSGEARVFRAGEASLSRGEIQREMERKFGFAMVSALVEHGGSLVL